MPRIEIADWERKRLAEVAEMLETPPRLPADAPVLLTSEDDIPDGFRIGLAGFFDMSSGGLPVYSSGRDTALPSECGSACCIGGWAYLLQHGKAIDKGDGLVLYHPSDVRAAGSYVGARDSYFVEDHPLTALYYPREIVSDWALIPPATAARAIRIFLETGEADWRRAVEETGAKLRFRGDPDDDTETAHDEHVEEIR